MALANKSVSAVATCPRAAKVVSCRPRTVRARFMPTELIAAAGDVDAPLAVPIVAALVVTAAVTFIVPAYLNRGQEAADKIFSAKEKAPLDKKGAKTTKGGKTTRR